MNEPNRTKQEKRCAFNGYYKKLTTNLFSQQEWKLPRNCQLTQYTHCRKKNATRFCCTFFDMCDPDAMIENVKFSDAKEQALRMEEKSYAFKTINNHKRSLKAAFCTAIQDDFIRKNLFDFQLDTVGE